MSYDQHADNLDASGHGVLRDARATVTELEAASRFGANSIGVELCSSSSAQGLATTASAMRHRSNATERLTDPVSGFLIKLAGGPSFYAPAESHELPWLDEKRREL
ncbi:MAG: hypothetical protein H2045_09940 [Rhizobiales bacterium]|nr:hypothetical protein [Hyphomicrobiales bacterium]